MTARNYSWCLVGVLWVVALLNYIDRQVIFSVFPLLSTDLKLSNVELGLLSSVFLWTYGVLSPISGFLADRFGRSRLITISLLVWSAVTLATGFASNFGQLIAARALMGISEACYLPAALGKITEYHGTTSRSLAVGVHQTGLFVGMILGGSVGGWAGQNYGWRMPFLVLGAIGIAYFAVVLLFFRNEPAAAEIQQQGAQRSFFSAITELFRLPGFFVMFTVFAATSIANWLVYTWMPLYIFERFHVSLAEAGFTATFYFQIASFGGILAGGWLADRLNSRTAKGGLYLQSAGVLLASAFLFLLAGTDSRLVLIAGLLAYGVGRGFYECNTMPVFCQIAPEELRSTGYGIFNFGGCVAGGIVAGLAGRFKDSLGLSGAFQIAACIMLLSGFLLLTLRTKPNRAHFSL